MRHLPKETMKTKRSPNKYFFLFSLEQVLMNDEVIQTILNYANEHLFEPGGNWPKSAIMERSYERWAVDEILLAIMDHPMTEADLVIEGFILKMELFLHMSEEPTNNYIFQVAENTAETLLGLIL